MAGRDDRDCHRPRLAIGLAPVANAIRRNPWGPAARTAETVVGWDEHYGIDALMTGVIRRAREDITQRGRAEYAAQIRAWRLQSG